MKVSIRHRELPPLRPVGGKRWCCLVVSILLLGSLAACVLAQTHARGMATPSTGARPWWSHWQLIALLVVVGAYAAFMLLRKRGRLTRVPSGYVSGLALLAGAFLLTSYLVAHYRRPGQTTLLQANLMDMSTMRAPEGSVPVATEVVKPGRFARAVTYTGTVVAYRDEDVYPRVTGTIVSLPVYPGDRVERGRLLVKLDDAELSARTQVAAWEQEMRRQGVDTSAREVEMADAGRQQAEAEGARARAEVEVSKREVVSGEAMVKESASEVQRAEHELAAARSQLTAAQEARKAAQAEAEMAKATLTSAQAQVDSAKADVEYWQAEMRREKQLLDAGAVSVEEHEREQAQATAANSRLTQAQAAVSERKSALAAAQARSRQAEADIANAQAQLAALGAAVEQVRAKAERAQADLSTAQSRVEGARAMLRAAEAMLAEKSAGVRASKARSSESGAALRQSTAALTVARTVRGYTEIRAQARGRIIERAVSPGVLVNPGTVILRVAQIDRVRLQAYVPEGELTWLRVGCAVEATDPKLRGGSLHARLTSIFPAADPASRTATVEALVNNPGEVLYPGDAVAMKLLAPPKEGALTVPTSAIVYRTLPTKGPDSKQQATVWVALQEAGASAAAGYTCLMHPEVHSEKPGTCPKCGMELVPCKPGATGKAKKAHQVEVTLGASDGARTEALAGLREGDEVIYRGHESLHEGDLVYPVPYGPEGPLELPPPPTGPMEGGMQHGGHEGAMPAPERSGHGGMNMNMAAPRGPSFRLLPEARWW